MGKDKGNPEGRKGEKVAQTTFRTGRPLALRQRDAEQHKGVVHDKVWLRGKGK